MASKPLIISYLQIQTAEVGSRSLANTIIQTLAAQLRRITVQTQNESAATPDALAALRNYCDRIVAGYVGSNTVPISSEQSGSQFVRDISEGTISERNEKPLRGTREYQLLGRRATARDNLKQQSEEENVREVLKLLKTVVVLNIVMVLLIIIGIVAVYSEPRSCIGSYNLAHPGMFSVRST